MAFPSFSSNDYPRRFSVSAILPVTLREKQG